MSDVPSVPSVVPSDAFFFEYFSEDRTGDTFWKQAVSHGQWPRKKLGKNMLKKSGSGHKYDQKRFAATTTNHLNKETEICVVWCDGIGNEPYFQELLGYRPTEVRSGYFPVTPLFVF